MRATAGASSAGHSHPLAAHRGLDFGEARDVAPRLRKACDEAVADRIGHRGENSARRRIFDGAAEAKLIALTCTLSSAPATTRSGGR